MGIHVYDMYMPQVASQLPCLITLPNTNGKPSPTTVGKQEDPRVLQKALYIDFN